MVELTYGVFYFSGTGNTKTVITILSQKLKDFNIKMQSYAIEEYIKNKKIREKVNNTTFNKIGIAYPVHAFSAPEIVYDFLKIFPKQNNISSFLIKTAGDPLGNAGETSSVVNAMKKKGLIVNYERLVVMPANLFIKYSDPMIKELLIWAALEMKYTALDLRNEIIKHQKNPLFLKIFSYLFSTSERIGAREMGKYFYVSSNCNLCKKCINICPRNNIKFKNGEIEQILFDNNCILCLRCIYNCPKRAIGIKGFDFALFNPFYSLRALIQNNAISISFFTMKTNWFYRRIWYYLRKNLKTEL